MTSRALARAISDPVAIASSATPSGTIAYFHLSAAPSGWLKLNGSTIGSAASGAGYANDGTSGLFAALWADPNLAILTSSGGASTRGASAAADFAANKRITMPDWRGEFPRGLDDGRGVDASRALGSAQAADIAAHAHTASTTVTSASAGTPSGTLDSQGAHTHTINVGTGSGTTGSPISTGVGNSAAQATSSSGAHTHTFTGTALAAHGHTATTTVNNSTGTETRPRNICALACIKL